MRAAIRAARALVFPSLWYEGQPLTMLEAKGRHADHRRRGCAGRQEVEDEEAGLWFASADVGDLSRTLIRIRDDSLVTGLAEGAYTSFWSDPPTRARHVERILTVYRSMLAPQPAAHTLPREAAE